jgi:Helix-turn-helix domain
MVGAQVKPQTKAVALWLIKRGSITPMQAQKSLGIYRLAAAVHELRRKHNVYIETRIIPVRTRAGIAHVAKYSVPQ